MKCSVKNCGRAGNHHMKTPSGTTTVLCETHARDLFKKLHPSSQTKEEEQELAPVIDIKTRKRIGSWDERYAMDSNAIADLSLLGGASALAAFSLSEHKRDMRRNKKQRAKERKKQQQANPEEDVDGMEKESAFWKRDGSNDQCQGCGEDFSDAKKRRLPYRDMWIRINTGTPIDVKRSEGNSSLCVGCKGTQKSSSADTLNHLLGFKVIDAKLASKHPKLMRTLFDASQRVLRSGDKDRIEDFKDQLNLIAYLEKGLEDWKRVGDDDDYQNSRETLHDEVHANLGEDTIPRDSTKCDLCEEDEKKLSQEGFRVI